MNYPLISSSIKDFPDYSTTIHSLHPLLTVEIGRYIDMYLSIKFTLNKCRIEVRWHQQPVKSR